MPYTSHHGLTSNALAMSSMFSGESSRPSSISPMSDSVVWAAAASAARLQPFSSRDALTRKLKVALVLFFRGLVMGSCRTEIQAGL